MDIFHERRGTIPIHARIPDPFAQSGWTKKGSC